jgi:DNA-binding CsgD family transcriptional regulator/tetratricopeptide (TPR) repeat protein
LQTVGHGLKLLNLNNGSPPSASARDRPVTISDDSPDAARRYHREVVSASIRDEDGNEPRTIVGRGRELEAFRAAFGRALSGRRQFVLVSGEPGIGKTRCAEALAEIAEDQGSLVLWGRCREEPGSPPYWPWIQILRAYVAASSPDEVRLIMGSAANDIAALLPELVESSQAIHPTPSVMSDANAARFRTFDAISQFLLKAAQQVPLTLVFDNLHWADSLSLSLIEFITQELTRGRLLLAGTFRDGEVQKNAPLLAMLGGLSRDGDVERIHLSGLSPDAIGKLAESMCGTRLPDSVIDTICQRTDGNPLFATELIKILLDESAGNAITAVPSKIPAGVRETIARRVTRLPPRCNALLGVAAVYGRQFTAQELAAAAEESVADVLAGLEPAMQAGIVDSTDDVAGNYQFTHALIRETIYEELPALDRLRIHARAADALVSVHAARLEPVLDRIALHYHAASTLGNPDNAVLYALRAADNAVRMGAHEDALRHYDRAIETLERRSLILDERLARARILQGSALRQLGQVQRSVEVLLEAVKYVHTLGGVELLVDALMALTMTTRHIAQQHLIPMLNHALNLLPPAESGARAKALATRAFAYRVSTDAAGLEAAVEEALQMAARCADTATRCACYHLATMALRGDPATLSRRLQFGAEHIAVAHAASSADLLAEAYYWQALNYLEHGRLDELEELLERYGSLGVARYGLHQYLYGAYRITLSLLRGEWTGLEALIERQLEIGNRTRRGDADGVYGAQMFALNRDLGRLPSLKGQVEHLTAAQCRVWQPGMMLLYAEIGMLDEARRIFIELADHKYAGVCRDDMYVTCLVFCAEACCALRDAARAAELYELLSAYAGQTANHPTAVCFGAADLYLAGLAGIAGWPERAVEHFERAIALNRSMRAWPWLVRSLVRHGTYLLSTPNETQRASGLQQLREAEHLARRIGMTQLIEDIDRLLEARDAGAILPDHLTAREAEVLRLLAIGRTNKDVSLALSISLNTVATHVRSILGKTNCANRTEAAAYAMRHGLLHG